MMSFGDVDSVESKRFLDMCTKAGGADEVQESMREAAREELERRKKENLERVEKEEKELLTDLELYNLKVTGLSLTDRKYGRTINGEIKNDNNFKVYEVTFKIELFSDKELTNKLGEDTCKIGSIINQYGVFYPGSIKKFEQHCYSDIEDFSWFTYKIISAKRVELN
ncbi:hypothetical protein BMS3Abin15_00027 [bacterium BMS3Abin15]|nr:hypothetical protein BMS3Abin15_00027 [bacterium BMS3Abin15]